MSAHPEDPERQPLLAGPAANPQTYTDAQIEHAPPIDVIIASDDADALLAADALAPKEKISAWTAAWYVVIASLATATLVLLVKAFIDADDVEVRPVPLSLSSSLSRAPVRAV